MLFTSMQVIRSEIEVFALQMRLWHRIWNGKYWNAAAIAHRASKALA